MVTLKFSDSVGLATILLEGATITILYFLGKRWKEEIKKKGSQMRTKNKKASEDLVAWREKNFSFKKHATIYSIMYFGQGY